MWQHLLVKPALGVEVLALLNQGFFHLRLCILSFHSLAECTRAARGSGNARALATSAGVLGDAKKMKVDSKSSLCCLSQVKCVESRQGLPVSKLCWDLKRL